jgi:dephospho-CoA kinase
MAKEMMEVGLTGNVASGKSTVARVWAAAGVPVVSADELAREAVAPGTEGLAQVVGAFGSDILTPEGTLDRGALRARVLADPDARVRLEAILHPRIAALRARWLEARRAEGHPLVVSEIPLLFEVGLENTVDQIVLVHAPQAERIRRLVADRGLSEGEARALVAAQGEAESKRERAHHVLLNDADAAMLESRALTLLETLQSLASAARSDAGPGVPSPAPTLPAPEWLRIDLHLHTWGSWDSRSDPAEILARARRRGIERIAITDHNRLHVALEWAQREPDRVIPGEEVKTAEGIDVIGLYLTREIPKGTPMLETCAEIRAQGGIVYLPHPYAAGKGGSGRHAERLAEVADVIEVFNARLLASGANARGQALAERTGRRWGAGSDAHTPGEVGNAYVEVPWHPNTPEGLLEALTHARIHGERANPWVFVKSNAAKLLNRVVGPAHR